jgi:1,4-alpha-glucan branching enzyme
MIDLNEVGAHPSYLPSDQWEIRFGIYLPGITPAGGYSIKVRAIHELDQFVPTIPPVDYDLNWVSGSAHDLWNLKTAIGIVPGTNYGTAGTYLYRFQLLRNNQPIVFWFTDPFARESGIGTFSAFRIGPSESMSWTDSVFKVPHVYDMVVYELHAGEFNRTFSGVQRMLDYLEGLGVNVIELMPFTNVKESVEWGYTPLGFFAPDERFGGAMQLKKLINQCHSRGIAVILDAVYAHAHPEFPYNLVYNATGVTNPMMGPFAEEFFPNTPGTDYTKAFTQDYFLTLNKYWIDEYHIDGFRYDYVPGIYDGNMGQGYSWLVYNTYQYSKAISRFKDPTGFSRIIQCAENLPDPKGILSKTYSSCCWQNQLMDKAADTAYYRYMNPGFAFLLDPEFIGYPTKYDNPATGETFPVAPFQYIESHDNPRFITRLAPSALLDLLGNRYGDRSKFYSVQPYVISLYTAKGIPMLWQGQEICENWGMVGWGTGRNLFERPMHWEYFYDMYGKALIRLYRILATLRKTYKSLSGRGSFYYYNDVNHYTEGVIVIKREMPSSSESLMIFINFSEFPRDVWVPFPKAGTYIEQIDKNEPSPRPSIDCPSDNQWQEVTVPSYYGCIYAKS